MIIVLIAILCLIKPPIYSTDILSNVEKYQFDDSYQAYLLNKKYGEISIVCEEGTKDCVIHAEFKKSGKTELIL